MTFFTPTYNVKYYRDGLYKLIKFNSPRGYCLREKEEEAPSVSSHDEKLAASLSRAKSVIFQLAMCNEWQYFFTGTISGNKLDRHDLFSFRNRLSQFIRDQRKKPGYENLAYVLIPEKHKDGAWHMHGLISGLPDDALSYFVPGVHPKSLVDGEYRNWPAYSAKFGYCSLGRIKDQEAVSAYLVKYISKDMQSSVMDVGARTYFASQGLRRAMAFGSIYGDYPVLDLKLDVFGPFVSTGFVRDVSWHYWLDYVDLSAVEFFSYDDPEVEKMVAAVLDQLVIAGFPSGSG